MKVVSAEGLPDGWVIPPYSLCNDEAPEKPAPPKYSVIAFSSKAAMDRYMEANMSEKF
jgi:hypothetical protein